MFPDPPKKASLEGVPELGLCSGSFALDLVDAFRRKMSLIVATSGPQVDDLRLLELENRKLPRVIPPSWLDSTEGGRPESCCPDLSRRRNPHRDDPSEPSLSFLIRPLLTLSVRLELKAHKSE